MTVRVVTKPTVEPLTLAQVKLHLREDLTEQDALITALITAAREYAEAYTGRTFITQTLELTLSSFPWAISVPRPPLQRVESIKYIDINGVLQTVDAATYQVDIYREPALIKPAYGEAWPATRSDFNAVQVRFVAGYAEAGSPTGVDPANSVPELVKQWMRVRVAQLYEHREAIVTGTIVAPIPKDFVDGLLDPLRVDLFS